MIARICRRSVRPMADRNLNCGVTAHFFLVSAQRNVVPQVGSQRLRADFGNKNHHVRKPGSLHVIIQIPLFRQHIRQRTRLGCRQFTFRYTVDDGVFYLGVRTPGEREFGLLEVDRKKRPRTRSAQADRTVNLWVPKALSGETEGVSLSR